MHVGISALVELDLVTLDQRELLALLDGLEVEKRRLAPVDHRVVAEIDDRKLAHELCAPNTAAVLRARLRISAREATRRVRAAANFGPRRTLCGEPLPPLFTSIAAAQADGRISAEHALVITRAVDQLPVAIQAEREDELQAGLLAHADNFDPDQLNKIARRWVDVLDPDGTLTEYADHERNRELTLSPNRDGSYTISGRLTPLCGAIWRPILDSLSKPVPADDGARDERRPGQRRADGFQEAGLLLNRAEQLPHAGGAAVTLLVNITDEQLRTGEGLATTAHGDLIPVIRILDLAGEAQTMSVQLDPRGGVMNYGRTKRIVPPEMRRAIAARDRGCTFPGCDRPPAWTEAHHFLGWLDGGETSIENCGLVCGFHHREFQRRGWLSVMLDGLPYWIPPAWLDPEQRPRRNTTFDSLTRGATSGTTMVGCPS